MLAGVLLPLCLAPVTGLVGLAGVVGPVVLAWVVMHRISPALGGAGLAGGRAGRGGRSRPGRRCRAGDLAARRSPGPRRTGRVPAVVSIAIPLYIVTMASQNVPGVAVMSSYGYQVPWRETMTVTGIGTLVGAPFGGHAINLAAITAAMTAGPTAGPDRSRRWIAGVSGGGTYLVLALGVPRPDRPGRGRARRRDPGGRRARAARHPRRGAGRRARRRGRPRGRRRLLRGRRVRRHRSSASARRSGRWSPGWCCGRSLRARSALRDAEGHPGRAQAEHGAEGVAADDDPAAGARAA